MPMRHCTILRLVLPAMALVAGACSSGDGNDTPDPVALALQPLGAADNPVMLTAPPGDARLFIAEKRGVVRIHAAGAFLDTPFLDIQSRIRDSGEQGLLGLAFDPDYATNGRFFVSYSNLDGDNVLESFIISADPNVADPGSGTIRLVVPQPRSNHNGGHIVFGADGYLYVGRGDGGGGGDPDATGQSRADLLGSILRLDVSGASGYTIPADNPFTSEAGARGEIWSYGLRNPWRFSFDRSTGDLYVADVGQDAWEEVNVVAASNGAGRGTNFGWNVMEGLHCFEPATGCDMGGLTLPVLEYGRGDGCSVTGGFVYRGSAMPALQGTYFYSDYCGGWIRTFRYQGGDATAQQQTTLDPGEAVLSFGEDDAGELYVLTSGSVLRIVPAAP